MFSSFRAPLALAVALSLSACQQAPQPEPAPAPAEKPAPAAAPAFDLSSVRTPFVRFQAADLDAKVPACGDFNAHVNGSWLAAGAHACAHRCDLRRSGRDRLCA